MKRIIFIILVHLALLPLAAQNIDAAYGKGAVKEVNGKVVFSKTIRTSNDDDRVFNLMDNWLKNKFNKKDDPKNRIVFSDFGKKEMAAVGEEELVFRSNTLFIDRAFMVYQLLVEVEGGNCKITVRNIKYRYNDGKKEEIIPAEELITDDIALNKEGTKLNRYYDKFRVQTIDKINADFDSANLYLNNSLTPADSPRFPAAVITPAAPVEEMPPVSVASTAGEEGTTYSGFRKISADKIPGNIIKLLGDWTLITSGKEKVNTMTASWGGLGVLWEQPVSFCFINPTRYSINMMDEGDVYTISFYTAAYREALEYCGSHSGRDEDKIKKSGLTPLKMPSGATAFSEAWMIIECEKMVAQPISPSAVTDKTTSGNWSKDGYHKLYIGKILNVWIK